MMKRIQTSRQRFVLDSRRVEVKHYLIFIISDMIPLANLLVIPG